MRFLAIATDRSRTAKFIGLYNDPSVGEFNADKVNTKIKETWAKIRGALTTFGVLTILSLVFKWIGYPVTVKELELVLGSFDTFLEAAYVIIGALSLVIGTISSIYKDE